jgi:hypothetical protein
MPTSSGGTGPTRAALPVGPGPQRPCGRWCWRWPAITYETVLQEGRPADILAYVDGALLADLWDELVLPRAVRSAWAPLVAPPGREA